MRGDLKRLLTSNRKAGNRQVLSASCGFLTSPHPTGRVRKSLSPYGLVVKIEQAKEKKKKKEKENKDNGDGGDAFYFCAFPPLFFFHSFLKSWKNISSSILLLFSGPYSIYIHIPAGFSLLVIYDQPERKEWGRRQKCGRKREVIRVFKKPLK
jgi:hypothetical protein